MNKKGKKLNKKPIIAKKPIISNNIVRPLNNGYSTPNKRWYQRINRVTPQPVSQFRPMTTTLNTVPVNKPIITQPQPRPVVVPQTVATVPAAPAQKPQSNVNIQNVDINLISTAAQPSAPSVTKPSPNIELLRRILAQRKGN